MSSYKPALALAAITLVTHVSAWYPNRPRCTDTYQPFTPLGCYANGQDGQPGALMERMDMDAYNMTIEACTGTCKGNGFAYAALGWIGSCYCGQTINRPTVDSSMCNLKCSGNNAETCGGDSSVLVYKDDTFPDITAQTTDAYTSLGCYTDVGTKPVFFRQDSLSSGNLTTKACLQTCLNGRFPYAATEFGGECYCGVILGEGVSSVDASQCNMACNGASGEMCGGRNLQNVYLAKSLACSQPCGYKPQTAATTSLVTYIVSPMPSTVAGSSTISTVASSAAVDIPPSSPLPESTPSPACEAGYGYGGCAPTAPTVVESSSTSTIASSEAITAPSSTPIVSTSSPLPESTSSPACEAGYGGCAPTVPTVAESSPASTIASSEAVTAPSSTPAISTSSPLPESSSSPACEVGYGGCAPTAPTVVQSSSTFTIASSEAVTAPSSVLIVSTSSLLPESTSSPACEYGYGGCAPTAPTVAESSSTIASSEAVSVPSSTLVTSTIASSEAINVPSSAPVASSSSTPICNGKSGYGGCVPTSSTYVATVSSAGPETVPSPSTSTYTVSIPETLPASSPSVSSSYAVVTPSTSTEVISISSTLAVSSSTAPSIAVNVPSTSTSTYVVSMSATLPASSPTTSTLVIHVAPSSSIPSSYVISTPVPSPSTPIVSISSMLAVTTSTPIVKIPSTTPLTTLKISTTATALGACISVVVAPPKCDFGCGKFCYSLPEFKDSKGCTDAWSHCMVNVASCYMKAGIPDALNCNGFAQWCGKVQEFCKASPAGNKDSCTKAWPPVKPTSKPELQTKTMTVPCATSKPAALSSAAAVSKPAVVTKAKPVTTTLTTMPPTKPTGICPIPTPTGVCQQPKNAKYGYDVDKPLGGIKLAALTCNNLEKEHRDGRIFKLYTDEDTHKCASFTKPQCADGCSQACRAQYDQCVSVYAEGCRTKGKYNGKSFGQGYSKGAFVGATAAASSPRRNYLRTDGAGAVSFADSYDSAKSKCTQQFRDCQAVNKRAVSEKCKVYGNFS